MAKKVWDLDAILAAKKPVTAEVALILDPVYGEELADARKALTRAEMAIRQARSDEARTEAEAKAEEAQADIDRLHKNRAGKVLDFRFAGLNPIEYDRVVQANQPTAQQRAAANKDGKTLMWNPEAFPAALVATCLVEPKLSEEDVAAMLSSEVFNQAEVEALFSAALRACTTAHLDDA